MERCFSTEAMPHADAGDADERFRLLVESVRDYAIFMLDERGRIVTWNLGAERIKGYRRDEIIGRHFSVFYPREEAEGGVPDRELVEAARLGRVELEGWRLRKDGSRFWANVVITALRNADGTLRGFAKVTRDLTARREAEHAERRLAAEQAAREVAERAASFQRNMTAIVGHDLRTPLSVVITAAEMIHRSARFDPELRPHMNRVLRGARRIQEIVSTLLDYAHAQRPDGIPITPRDDADVNKVCERVVQDASTLAAGRQIAYEGHGSPLGHWDEARLEQVVQNLVSNALKYGSADGVVTVRWLRADDGDTGRGTLVLSVHNDGAPIPAALLPHVFEPFRRGAAEVGTRNSLGLGLFIVKEIVQAHRGCVDVVSDERSGTTFTVTLPGSAAQAEAKAARQTPHDDDSSQPGDGFAGSVLH